ncbi:hypothetical protein HanPI659440_Chr01g0029391 [Helianthus annuus]|nr:hypothetical protein HanPI659440_Chr01g0029391 [Helianthus annuus]
MSSFGSTHSRVQWRTQKLFVGGADEVLNHIFKGCGRVFCLKDTLIFFSRGAAAHPGQRVGPTLPGWTPFGPSDCNRRSPSEAPWWGPIIYGTRICF